MIATNIRKEARENLKGKWFKAVGILLLEIIISSLINGIVNFLTKNINIIFPIIIKAIIQIPLFYGLIHSFIKLKRNEEVKCFDFLKIGFSNFEKSCALFLRTLQKMILPIIVIVSAIILIMVFIGVGGAVGIAHSIAGKAMVILILSVIVFVAAIAYAVIIGLKYALATYIAYDNQDMTAKDIVEKSEELMVGHRGDLFVLFISFLGWIILCCIPFILLGISSILMILPMLPTILFMLFLPFTLPFLMYWPDKIEGVSLPMGLTFEQVSVIFGVSAILGIFALIGGLFLIVYIIMAKVCFYDDILQAKVEEKE